MDDLEKQCEDALFELCDARERYPLRCANELQKCIKLTTNVHMVQVVQKSSAIYKPPPSKHNMHFNINVNESEMYFEHLDYTLQNIIQKLDNLKAVMDQIEREKTCWTNKLLQA